MRERLARVRQTPVVAPGDLQALQGGPLTPARVANLRERLVEMNRESAQVRDVARALLDVSPASTPAPTESILL